MLQENKKFFQPLFAPGNFSAKGCLFLLKGVQSRQPSAACRGFRKTIRRGKSMTYQEVLEQARGAMGPYCKACPVCNGLACRNTVPGPGAKGIGTGFIRNYQKWQEPVSYTHLLHSKCPPFILIFFESLFSSVPLGQFEYNRIF